MRNRVAALVALGIAAYLAFLLAMLPARMVTSRVALPPGFTLAGVEGTVWHGRASLSGNGIGPDAPLNVEWHWRVLPIFSGRMAYDVTAHGTSLDARGTVARGFRATSAEDFTLDADAASIAAWIPLASAWQPRGRLHARIDRLAWDGRDLLGRADAQWNDAALALSSVNPVGSYAVKVEGAGGPARMTLTTVKGPLRLAGDGTLDGLAHFAFTGEARAEGPDAAALTPLLDLLGPRRADGSRALRFAS